MASPASVPNGPLDRLSANVDAKSEDNEWNGIVVVTASTEGFVDKEFQTKVTVNEHKRKFHHNRHLQVKYLPTDVSKEEIRQMLSDFPVSQINLSNRQGTAKQASVYLEDPEMLEEWDSSRTFMLRGQRIPVSPTNTDNLLCVARLPLDMTEKAFCDLVSRYGEVKKVKTVSGEQLQCFLMISEKTGESKGYGCVEYSSKEAALAAKKQLGGKKLTEADYKEAEKTNGTDSSASVGLWAEFVDPGTVNFETLHSKCLYVSNLPESYHDMAGFRKKLEKYYYLSTVTWCTGEGKWASAFIAVLAREQFQECYSRSFNTKGCGRFSAVVNPPYCQIAMKNGCPLTWGLVEYTSAEDAELSFNKLHGSYLRDKKIRVDYYIPGVRAIHLYMKLVDESDPLSTSSGNGLLPDPPEPAIYETVKNLRKQNPVFALTVESIMASERMGVNGEGSTNGSDEVPNITSLNGISKLNGLSQLSRETAASLQSSKKRTPSPRSQLSPRPDSQDPQLQLIRTEQQILRAEQIRMCQNIPQLHATAMMANQLRNGQYNGGVTPEPAVPPVALPYPYLTQQVPMGPMQPTLGSMQGPGSVGDDLTPQVSPNQQLNQHMVNGFPQFANGMQPMVGPVQYVPVPILPSVHGMQQQGLAVPLQQNWIYPGAAAPPPYSSGLVSNALTSFMQAAQQMSENGRGPNFNLTLIEQNAPSTHYTGEVGQVVDGRVLNDNRGQVDNSQQYTTNEILVNDQRTQIGQMLNSRTQMVGIDPQAPYFDSMGQLVDPRNPVMVRDLRGNLIDARTIYNMVQNRPDPISVQTAPSAVTNFAKPIQKSSSGSQTDLTSLVKSGGKPYSPSGDSRRLYNRGMRGSSSEEEENRSSWSPSLQTTPQRQKRRHNSILPSPEASPDGNYIGQHSQGLGGHYPDSYFKRPRM